MPKENLSAQVVLRSASSHPSEPATAANVHMFAPAEKSAQGLLSYFRDAGFETGPLVGNSFSITGSVDLFERVFGNASADESVLSTALLDTPDSSEIDTVIMTPPPDFGPTSH